MLSAYRKTVASIVGTFLTWAGVAYVPDGHIDRVEWYALALAAATSLGVYGVNNYVRVAPEPVVLEPEPSSVKFVAPVPVPATSAAPLTLVPAGSRVQNTIPDAPDYVPGRRLSSPTLTLAPSAVGISPTLTVVPAMTTSEAEETSIPTTYPA